MKKHLSYVLCLLVVLSVCLTGCSGGNKEKKAEIELLPAAGVASDIFTVFRGEDYVLKAYDASVLPYIEELYMPVDCVVEQVLVRPGDRVKAGDMLVKMNLENELKREAELAESIRRKTVSNEYDNRILQLDISMREVELRELISKSADSREIALKELDIENARLALSQQMEKQELALQAERTELERLKADLAYDAVYAPFDGVIARSVDLRRGSRVPAYQTMVYLADETKLYISSQYISDSTFSVADGGIYALIGDARYEISYRRMDPQAYVSAILAGSSIYSEFDIIGPDGWQEKIEPGMYAAVILSNNYDSDALLIPANAVLNSAGGKYVYVVTEDGGREKRDIKVRIVMGGMYARVLEGLTEGERIYVTDK